MKLEGEQTLLRVHLRNTDIVMKARELGLAGATVLRGPMGFGANSRVHTTKLLELSDIASYGRDVIGYWISC